jgi:hypothetical protein
MISVSQFSTPQLVVGHAELIFELVISAYPVQP